MRDAINPSTTTPDTTELALLDRYWRAANYLSVGQIYLLDNPLLREPLRAGTRQAAAARALGHDAGAEFHLRPSQPRHQTRRTQRDLYLRPRPWRPGMVANTYLEGTYSEIYPDITRDEEGLRKLFRQFSFPGGIPSHAAPETPGSIHEGGELGYALSMPMARPSTIPILWSPASSVTARPKPGRSPPHGIPTSFSTRP